MQRREGGMYTLAEAAKAVGRDKSTLLRAVRRGRISATRDAEGIWRIDESELRRVYPANAATPGDAPGAASADTPDALPDAPHYTGELRQVLARLTDAQDQIAYLRAKLDRVEEKFDRATEELATERAKVTALLTDQRAPPAPRQSWWRWRRIAR
jgi:excisionase family DNA binding protein